MIAVFWILVAVAVALGLIARRARITMPGETELRLALHVGFGTLVVLVLIYGVRILKGWIL